MSKDENFLSRWSRLKQEAERADQHDAGRGAEADAPAASPAHAPAAAPAAKPDDGPQTEFDVSSLPPIESIGAGTDIRLFLQKGVPLELTRAALRRAWTTDPAIRDFIEVAENQWDFATGSDLPGFGDLDLSDDVRRIVAEIVQGREPLAAAPPRSKVQNVSEVPASGGESPRPDPRPTGVFAAPVAENASTPAPEGVDFVQRNKESVAAQSETKVASNTQPSKPRHGGALPE
jgi:hypothetical protein